MSATVDEQRGFAATMRKRLCVKPGRWPRWIGLGLALTLTLEGAAPAGGKDRLRRLVRLPRLNFEIGVALDPLRGFAMMSAKSGAPGEIQELRKGMQGDGRDAPRYYRLGLLYRDLGNHTQANRALQRALELYRRQGAEQSDDSALLSGLGEVLAALGSAEEAERVLRQAVKVAPKEGRSQAALGRLLTRQSILAVAPEAWAAGGPSFLTGIAQEALGAKPTPAQAEKAQQLLGEALSCYGQAIELAPRAAEGYSGRAVARCTQRLLQAALRQAAGDDAEPGRLLAGMLSSDALVDLQAAARLDPKDAIALGTAALFEVFAVAAEKGNSQMDDLLQGAAWSTLPDHTRQSLRSTMNRLEELAQTSEGRPAAAALEVLGALQYWIVRDHLGAEASLRRALALDATRDQVWENLVVLFVSSERASDLLALCEERLKHQDSARNRVLLAKAHEQLNQPDRTLAEAEAAYRRYSEDFNANLALAAALLKESSDPPVLLRSAQLLTKAQQLLGSSPSRDQMVNLLVLRGLLFALADRPEDARANLRKALEIAKDHPEAKEALQMIE